MVKAHCRKVNRLRIDLRLFVGAELAAGTKGSAEVRPLVAGSLSTIKFVLTPNISYIKLIFLSFSSFSSFSSFYDFQW